MVFHPKHKLFLTALAGKQRRATGPTIADQTIEFGGLTKANAGGAKLLDSNGNEVDVLSIVSQSGFTRTWSVSGGRIVANGTPAVDHNKTMSVSTALGTVNVTIKSSGLDAMGRDLAISFSVRTNAESDSAFVDSPVSLTAATGPYNILFRTGSSYSNVGAYNVQVLTMLTFGAHAGATAVLPFANFNLCENFTLDGFKFYTATTPVNGNLCSFDVTNGVIKNCEFYGPELDPDNNTWEDLGGMPNTAWVGIVSGAAGLTIRNNIFHDLTSGVGLTGNGAQTISGNYFYRVFGDMINVAWGSGATTLTISDNVGVGILGGRNDNGGPPNDPHTDFMQIRGVVASDWTVNIWRNRYFNVYSRSSLNAPINVGPDGGSTAYIISNIRGNFVCGNAYAQNGVGAGRPKNCVIIGNTLVKNESITSTAVVNETPSISLGTDGSSGTHVIKNNVGGTLIHNSLSRLESNNIVARSGTETMSDFYVGTPFGSPDKDITNAVTNFMTRFAMAPNGDLDVDNSGTGTAGDVGCVGTGYVTWATSIPGDDGSFNLAYEAPVLSSPTGSATGATTANIGVTTDEPNGTLYWVVTTSSTKPTSAQIRAGQNHLGASAPASGSSAISSVGTKAASPTGLTSATTYYAHFIHRDSDSYDSNIVSSASFTTS